MPFPNISNRFTLEAQEPTDVGMGRPIVAGASAGGLIGAAATGALVFFTAPFTVPIIAAVATISASSAAITGLATLGSDDIRAQKNTLSDKLSAARVAIKDLNKEQTKDLLNVLKGVEELSDRLGCQPLFYQVRMEAQERLTRVLENELWGFRKFLRGSA